MFDSSRWRSRRRCRLQFERLEDRTLLAGGGLATASLIQPTDVLSEMLRTPGQLDYFKVAIPESGRLTVQTHAEVGSAPNKRLSLLGSDGRLLIQSEGISASNPDDQVAQHLLAGTYYLEVAGLGGATGAYTLTSDFVPAVPPLQPLPIRGAAFDVAQGDFNEDGITDLVTVGSLTDSFSVFLSLGDGTFAPPREIQVTPNGRSFHGVVAADVNGDGHTDLALVTSTLGVGVLLGRGDGTFQDPTWYAVGTGAFSPVLADFNGDGKLDLAVTNTASNDLSVLLGRGDGTFQDQIRLPAPGSGVNQDYVGEGILVAGDFNHDGHIDLAVPDLGDQTVLLFLGRGDGTFQDSLQAPTGGYPLAIATGDFNGDGRLDLAVMEDSSVAVLLGRGDGTFADPMHMGGWSFAGFTEITTGDFNGDGRLDLALFHDAVGTVYLGRGDGTFAGPLPFNPPDDSGNAFAVGDFNRDGKPDLVIGSIYGTTSILLGRGDGTFLDRGRIGVNSSPGAVASGDFNGDGIPDLAVQSFAPVGIAVYLGLGDELFQQPIQIPVDPSEAGDQGLVLGDFNHDGRLDLVAFGSEDIVLLGQGDGTFEDRGVRLGISGNRYVVVGDFNGDGNLDLAAVDANTQQSIDVLLGRGDGTFQDPVSFPVGAVASGLVAGDFDGDGKLDLATADTAHSQIVLLFGRGDGSLGQPNQVPAGSSPFDLVSGDFNGDGKLDLATFNFASRDVSVLLGEGDGAFQDQPRFAVGTQPLYPGHELIARDFNKDGRLDLAVLSGSSRSVSILLGRGDGTLAPPVQYPVGSAGSYEYALSTGDLNGDDRPDLVAGNANNLSLLFGRGDGTFQSVGLPVGTTLTSTSLVTGDFDLDGHLDVATARPNSGDAAVLLGGGDGTLSDPVSAPARASPIAIRTGDFNGDGRLDLVTANENSNDVTVSLGLGNGAFAAPQHYPVGVRPIALTAGDFSGNGRLDLAVVNAGSNDVSLLLGRGDGTFAESVRLPVGLVPDAILSEDFNDDGQLDLAVANYGSRDVSLLLGRGDGAFQAEVRLPVGAGPVALAAGDFNRDGGLDLVAVLPSTNAVALLLQSADGTFAQPVRFAAGTQPRSVVAADINGDGILDLAVANNNSNDVSVLLGHGDGTFRDQARYPVGPYPFAITAADMNGDGRLDLIMADQLGTETTILLGLGDGTFAPPDAIANSVRSTPLVADFNRDGAADVAVVDAAGDILLRLGRPGEPGAFDPPVIVNPDARFAARDLALVASPAGLLLAALDAHSSSVSLYAAGGANPLTYIGGFAVPGTLAVRLVSGDLNGDGRDDLVVAAAGSRQVFVYLQNAAGGFGPFPNYESTVGVDPLDISLVDLNGDHRPDIVVANHYSGDVSILLNDARTPFSAELRDRAGTNLYFLSASSGMPVVRSLDGTTGIVAGSFQADGQGDLVVTQSDANSFTLLHPSGAGGFLNPTAAETFPAGLRPTAIVSGRFDGDPYPDLAILDEENADVSIFLGDGHGGFTQRAQVNAGNLPSGLALADVNGDGWLDLLVGNQFGDVLTLLGNGDGTFQPYQRTDRHVALAIADLQGNGRPDFIFADQGLDRVTVQYAQPGQSFSQDRTNGVLAPGAVKATDLNADGIPDLVVANSGSNNVLIYLGLGNGQFSPAHSFFVGTNQAGVTSADLNRDGIPDLVVANEGSNDVSILLGQGRGASWTLTPGPRLRAGAGPVATTVQDVTGDGIPDLLVVNSQSNTVSLLPGVGQGFFNDQHPVTFATGSDPQQALVGDFTGNGKLDLVTLNAGSNDLTFLADFQSPLSVADTITFGGIRPVAAVAADFNHDGVEDLLVASNGNGLVSLLLGEPDGLTLARAFSRPDLLHPTDLALTDTAGVFNVYVAQEGRDSAFLLTSFGILVPAPARVAEEHPSLPDVFLISGPGFETAQSLPAAVVEQASFREGGDEASSLPPGASNPLVLTTLLLGGGGGGDDSAPAAEGPADTSSWLKRFLMGLEDPLPRRKDPIDDNLDGDSFPSDPLAPAVDEVFWQGLPELPSPEVVNQVASVVRGSPDPALSSTEGLHGPGIEWTFAPSLRASRAVDADRLLVESRDSIQQPTRVSLGALVLAGLAWGMCQNFLGTSSDFGVRRFIAALKRPQSGDKSPHSK